MFSRKDQETVSGHTGAVAREGSHWTDVAILGHAVISLGYPGELDLFDDVLAEFTADPSRFHVKGPLRPPVGMGVELTLASTYVLPVVSFLVGAVANRVADRAIDSVSEATWEKLAAVLRSRRSGTAESTPQLVVAQDFDADDNSAGVPVRLDPDQEREICAVVLASATVCGLDQARAQYLADSVLGALRLHGTRQ